MLPFDPSTRYDRQVRLWGEEGQASIGSTSACVLGSDSLATEILKSLVLAGVQSFYVVDDAKVEQADIGQNFFLHADDIGRSRAEATLEKLTELNPSVSGSASSQPPTALAMEDVEKLTTFSVVVAANQNEEIDTTFAKVLYNIRVPFICIKTFGLIGTIRICIKEHTIANSHEENPRPDLRLDAPFSKLIEMINETNLDEMTLEQLRHTPYILLHFKALEVFRKQRNDPEAFPSTTAERKELQAILMSFRRSSEESGTKDSENFDEAKAAVIRAFQRTTIGSSVKSILSSPQCSTSTRPFWLICEALRRFVTENNNLLPLRGTLPDMTSDSSRYTRLATLFHEKALSDAQEVLRLTREVEKERGVGDVISDDVCYRFCKNADRIRVQYGDVLDYNEETKAIVEKIRESNIDEETRNQKVDEATWMLLMRAVGRFQKEKGRYPGTNGVPVSIDAQDLKKRVEVLIREALKDEQDFTSISNKVTDTAIAEICRFGAAELHVISSYVGGIAAQEIIKLATNQYVPIDNTFIFDGHTQESATFKF
ncbi:NEDD8-activating enzyme E1 regulatory subunit [Caenorhabditis elegans]|uniref:NEDD8-activating enzyme E1 regulatory subunit n=1 Tax=Caenorhabditis elegans TaxID=6239 RepID=ULA1_CAEEL|nr:NEDD8-activating enzyme E1 regulatory subunit [Caenorhabditis elegans]Q18217.2 RecName: Full=NEDD8-activating enzyme E1 regulatory subunit; AltName: Full=Ubiquitin-like activation protein 1 [Caenorhabditis elegans]CCD65733.1 NEDD8-activating enzyme E1 regulatory subunit [Caenorhabditis elegans]|eukprot:NP_498037.2 NEDD8-activating enzyme E1 regulatory subunit [Caenorhabditis elegans]